MHIENKQMAMSHRNLMLPMSSINSRKSKKQQTIKIYNTTHPNRENTIIKLYSSPL